MRDEGGHDVRVQLRAATVDGAPALSQLWSASGLQHREDLVAEELRSVLSRDPELVIVAEDARGLAGSVFGAFDGRRAWVNRLATREDVRGTGVGVQLMKALETALALTGCRKINLLIEPENQSVVGFYERLGFTTDEPIFMEKRIDE